jgi:hypothetical protein
MEQQSNSQGRKLSKIEKKILILEKELALLKLELEKEKVERVILYENQKEANFSENTFKVGDRVVITNNYKGKKNTKATVTKVNSCMLQLHCDDGVECKRSKSNVKKIE